MTTVLTGQDSVNPAGMDSGLDVYCGYGAGTFTNISSVESRFPGKLYISIAPYVVAGVDCLDIETGDATPADAPSFMKTWKQVHTNKPVFYANASTMPSVESALTAAGYARSSYYLWVADWNGSSAIPSGYDGIQYASTSGYDADSFYSYMFGAVAPSTAPTYPLAEGMIDTTTTGPIHNLQNRLNVWRVAMGSKFAVLVVDGNFGPLTAAAVAVAQAFFGDTGKTGTASESFIANNLDVDPTAPVKNLKASPTYNSATISWTGTKGGSEGYDVQVSAIVGLVQVFRKTVSGTSVVVPLDASTEYQTRVSVVPAGEWTGAVKFTTPAKPVNFAAPGELAVGTPVSTAVNVPVSWDAVSGATSYVVKLENSAGVVLKTVTVSGTSTTLAGLTVGTSYTLDVSVNAPAGDTASVSTVKFTA